MPQRTQRLERRVVPLSRAELRMEGDEESGRRLVGRAIVFDELSEDLGGFRERVLPEALDGVLERSDIRGLFNHNPDHVLGRVRSETLRLEVRDDGLWYELDLPNTPIGHTVAENVARGDVDGNSFSFILEAEEWVEEEDGTRIRTITQFEEFFDLGPVTFPAYPQTAGSEIRSLDEVLEEGRRQIEEADQEAAEGTPRLDRARRRLQLSDMEG